MTKQFFSQRLLFIIMCGYLDHLQIFDLKWQHTYQWKMCGVFEDTCRILLSLTHTHSKIPRRCHFVYVIMRVKCFLLKFYKRYSALELFLFFHLPVCLRLCISNNRRERDLMHFFLSNFQTAPIISVVLLL